MPVSTPVLSMRFCRGGETLGIKPLHAVPLLPCHCGLLAVRKHLSCALKGTNSGQSYSIPSSGMWPPC